MIRLWTGVLLLLLLSGCASWFIKREPPDVLVTNMTMLDATAFEQRLQMDLRIRNPNDSDLAVTGIDFTLSVNGKRMARGLGNQEVTIPRLSDVVISVYTSTSTFDIIRQILSVSQQQDLAYEISGVFHSKDGRLPFDNSGVLLEQGQLTGQSSAP
ncbi:MAG TPA: LEA type 2 family protein [Nitrospira sp.]|nr:LEA type 2 family protein [Nitrospira sp.]